MSEKTVKFRTAAMGGFNRQDVVDYVESSAREHAQQLRELRAALKDTEEKAEAAERLEEELRTITAQRDELAARAESLAAAEAEVTALREQLVVFQPDAEAYLKLKGELSEIELQARMRAAQIISEAEVTAREMKAEASALLARISNEFNRSKLDTNSTLDSMIQQLTNMRSSLSGLEEAIQSGEAAISREDRHV